MIKQAVNQLQAITKTVKSAYVILDTSKIDPNLSGNGRYGWRFINYQAFVPGTVICPADLQNIISMRIMPVKMNIVKANYDGKVLANNHTNVNNQVNILIEELSTYAYEGWEGRKFHFPLFPAIMNLTYPLYGPAYTPLNAYIEYVTSGKGNGWFHFPEPITYLNTITVSIANPVTVIEVGRTLIPLEIIYMG